MFKRLNLYAILLSQNFVFLSTCFLLLISNVGFYTIFIAFFVFYDILYLYI